MKEFIATIIAFLIGVTILFFTFAGIMVLMGLLWAIPTMLLWDWLMPELFGLGTITIWQAWGLNILAGIFFKNQKTNDKNTDGTTKKKIILG